MASICYQMLDMDCAKNAKDTSEVAIGDQSHKVLDCIHVTKQQVPVSRRHEKYGTDLIYENLPSKMSPLRFTCIIETLASTNYLKTKKKP